MARLKVLAPRLRYLKTERVPIISAVDPAQVGEAWRRGKAGANARGYTYRWQKASALFLALNPLCAECRRRGRVTAAVLVDHIEPHRGDMVKFWDTQNWQSLCKPCHDSVKQRMEKGGAMGCDTDGMPLDPNHQWNQQDGRG